MSDQKRKRANSSQQNNKKQRTPNGVNGKDDDENSPQQAPIFIPIILPTAPPPPPPPSTQPPKSKKETMEDRIRNSGLDEKTKEIVLTRYKNIDCDKQKHMDWFENLLRVPFGKYSPLPIKKEDELDAKREFFKQVQAGLDDAVYGLKNVKEEIINYVAQFISTNNSSSPRIIGLHGSAGIGKTALIRRGLSEALKRPMKCISMGGITDSNHFCGFDFTYSGSRYGALVQALVETGVMNPIIFMDELDKISNNADGIEVQNLLVHITDPVQNHNFTDKYFSEINIDLSKVVFVFSFNDEKLINPILLDRIHTIRVESPDEAAKVIIAKKYLLRELAPNIGLKTEDVNIPDEVLKKMINQYCKDEKGVRKLKARLETLLLKVNACLYMGCKGMKHFPAEISLPFTFTWDMVQEVLKEPKQESFMSSMFI